MSAHDEDDLHNPVVIRKLTEADLAAIVAIDASVMKRSRSEYYRDKVTSALRDSRIHLSLVAELDGRVAGFLMARVNYGEFGRPEPTAVIDSLGVHLELQSRRVGTTLMEEFIRHAEVLDIEYIRTEVAWNDVSLLHLLDKFSYGPSGRLVLERALGDRGAGRK